MATNDSNRSPTEGIKFHDGSENSNPVPNDRKQSNTDSDVDTEKAEEGMQHSGQERLSEEHTATITESNTNSNTHGAHDEKREHQQGDTTLQAQSNESIETAANMDTASDGDHQSREKDNGSISAGQGHRPMEDDSGRGLTETLKDGEPQPGEKPPTPGASDSETEPSPKTQSAADWLGLQFDDNSKRIKKPDELEPMGDPPGPIDEEILNRIQGSMIGMALGDALGAHVEFRPRDYLVSHPVTDLGEGGTWGLLKGQFTDDTSMALCLANSLIVNHGFNPYDQLVRYKWWNKHGYMSSTGHCFDIGAATQQSVNEFHRRQKKISEENNISKKEIDSLSDPELLKSFQVYCSEQGVAGNGALMRLAPVPLFFYRNPADAVEYSGVSGQITHGDTKAYDACRYYGALIVAALQDADKDTLLDNDFYEKHKSWFGHNDLHPDIESIAKGSYKKAGGYKDGIRGKGYIVSALEAALWAFWSTEDFEEGALAAVNLGDDTDTTAAIYGQLAGAYYGYDNLPKKWIRHVYAQDFMKMLSKWIAYEGECWSRNKQMATSKS